MRLERHANKVKLEKQSAIYIDRPMAMFESAAAFSLFGVVAMPYIMFQISWETHLIQNILCFTILECVCLAGVYLTLQAGSFHFAANKTGWYYRPKMKGSEQFVFVPWVECTSIGIQSMHTGSNSLRFDVVKGTAEFIHQPRNGQLEVKKNTLVFLMNIPNKNFKAEEVVADLKDLKNGAVTLSAVV